jgi:hypothetical protein
MAFKNILSHLRSILAPSIRLGPDADEDGIMHANAQWKPEDTRRRVEIMVTGDPSRVGAVSNAIDELQSKVFKEASPGDQLELRVTGFLDNCIHRSKWHKKPFKAAAQARNWHCEQSRTRFADAFADSKGELLDTLVIIGHRFDDDIAEALSRAEELREQGVQIHCFHTGNDKASRDAYEKLATQTGGVFLQLTDQSSIGEVVPILMAHLNHEDSLLRLKPESADAKKLMKVLNPNFNQELNSPESLKKSDS